MLLTGSNSHLLMESSFQHFAHSAQDAWVVEVDAPQVALGVQLFVIPTRFEAIVQERGNIAAHWTFDFGPSQADIEVFLDGWPRHRHSKSHVSGLCQESFQVVQDVLDC